MNTINTIFAKIFKNTYIFSIESSWLETVAFYVIQKHANFINYYSAKCVDNQKKRIYLKSCDIQIFYQD